MEKLTKFIGHARSVEWLFNKLVPVVVYFFGGFIQIALARLTPLTKDAGPIIYSGIFFAGALILLTSYYILLHVTKTRMIIDNAKLSISNTQPNPLKTAFDKETINTSVFFSPFYIPHTKKRFTDCHVVGTGSIVLISCVLTDIAFRGCQIILIDPKHSIINATVFQECTFVGGRFTSCTIIMPREEYMNLPDGLKSSIPMISIGVS